jgi:hypothetical protein
MVSAARAFEGVVPGEAEQPVSAAAALDAVGCGGAGEDVVARGANQVFDAGDGVARRITAGG